MAAAIIEFDALTDTVGAATENDDFATISRTGFAFGRIAEVGLVSRVKVRSFRLEFRGTCIDSLVDGCHSQFPPHVADGRIANAREFCDPGVRKPCCLEPPHFFGGFGQTSLAQLYLCIDDLADPLQKPRVVAGDPVDFHQGHPFP